MSVINFSTLEGDPTGLYSQFRVKTVMILRSHNLTKYGLHEPEAIRVAGLAAVPPKFFAVPLPAPSQNEAATEKVNAINRSKAKEFSEYEKELQLAFAEIAALLGETIEAELTTLDGLSLSLEDMIEYVRKHYGKLKMEDQARLKDNMKLPWTGTIAAEVARFTRNVETLKSAGNAMTTADQFIAVTAATQNNPAWRDTLIAYKREHPEATWDVKLMTDYIVENSRFITETSATAGYAAAATQNTAAATASSSDPLIVALAAQLDALTKMVTSQASARGRGGRAPYPPNSSGHPGPSQKGAPGKDMQYCYSCGYQKTHKGADCVHMKDVKYERVRHFTHA